MGHRLTGDDLAFGAKTSDGLCSPAMSAAFATRLACHECVMTSIYHLVCQ
jgi:hypothetical protein